MPQKSLRSVTPDAILDDRPSRLSHLPIDQNPAAVYLAGLSAGSRPTMRAALDTLAALLMPGASALTIDWSALRFQHTAALRSHLAERYAAATANKMLAALRGALRAAWRLGLLSAEDYQRATEIDRLSGETLPAGRNVSAGELQALIAACAKDPSAQGARDAALLALLYGCGIRRAELVALDLTHYRRTEEALEVHGKRNKSRLCPIVNGASDALEDWLRLRGTEEGPLFVRIRRGDKIVCGARLTTTAVYQILQGRAQEAGVPSLSPHDLRRTFVGDLLDAGADISTVQKLAGHANVTTTARYDRRGEQTKRKAAQLLHVPYLRREP